MIPVFITPKERDEYNKTETKTKSYIITEILKIFKKMPLLETVAEFQHKLEKGERLKKKKIIDIFTKSNKDLMKKLQGSLQKQQNTAKNI